MTRFLFISDFEQRRDSGAAGSLIAIAEAIELIGHHVELLWRPTNLPGGGGAQDRFISLGARQTAQVDDALTKGEHDVVIVSQPFAFRVYEQLPKRHSGVLFLNRTHGWEARVYDERRRFGWDADRPWFTRTVSPIAEALARRACARTARSAQGIITSSTADATYLTDVHHVPASRIAVIPHGADGLGPVSRALFSGRMLYVGTWLPRKGSRILEKELPGVAIRHPTARLTIVTESDEHSRLKSILAPAFGARLTLLPWLGRESLDAVYAEHDVLLFPSFFEGFGKVWLEALRAGLCVVGFDAGGLPDIARDEKEALSAPKGDIAGFLSRLDRALIQPTLAIRLGAAGAALAKGYTWRRAAESMLAFCDDRRVALIG